MVLVLFVLGLAVLAVMALAAHDLAYFPGDLAISRAVQASWSDSLDRGTSAVSWTGFPPQSWLVFGGAVVVLVVLGYRWAAIVEALTALGSGELYVLLQQVVQQPRPSADLIRVAGSLPMTGFPSGHVTTFTAVFGFAAYIAYRRLGPSADRWVPVGVAVVVLGLMSFARIYSGQHWPSDVLAGLLLGGLWLGVVVWLYERGLEHSSIRRVLGPHERSGRNKSEPSSRSSQHLA